VDMTGSIPAEFHGPKLFAVTTLVCDAQHENIDFAGDMPGRPAFAWRSAKKRAPDAGMGIPVMADRHSV
jgi:hypothetical protein